MTSTQPRQKSGASRTSISVKLPNAEDDDRRSETSGNIGGPGNAPVQRDSVLETYTAPSNQKQPQRAVAHHRSTKLTFKERILIERTAVAIIERTWVSYRDCQMFRLLKHAVCAAENSLTTEILRKVSPKEAALLSDKSLQIRVRFRFGGSEFPPMIFFKLFIHTNGTGVKYISGKKVIKPTTGAAEEALRQMGNRVFYEQLLKDNIHSQQFRITDELDVTTLKDYMQYLANLDETPAQMGGKENYWRKLTLDDVPRHTMFYDVVDYLYSHRLSDRLRAEVPLLMLRPINQAIQRQHIKIVSQFRPLPTVYQPPPTTQPHSQYSGTERRSRQARRRARKMRRAFGLPDPEDSEMSVYEDGVGGYQPGTEGPEAGDDEWEEEANKLYEWTQELSFEDINSTPRIAT